MPTESADDEEITAFVTVQQASTTPKHPTFVVLSGRSMGRVIPIDATEMTIGRSPELELVFDDDGISREHCRITLHDTGQVSVRDLGSTNGTFIEDARVRSEPRVLREGERLRMGPEVILKFTVQDAMEQQFLSQLYESATRDWLTGLPNRRAFVDQASQELAWHRRHDQCLSVLMLDIDHFKQVNDTHGHPAGDAVLKEVGATLRETVREEDLLARWGGEEFVVLLRRTPQAEGLMLAERLRAAIEAHRFTWKTEQIPLTVSIGLTSRRGVHLSSLQHLVAESDEHLYQAKNSGRNRVSG